MMHIRNLALAGSLLAGVLASAAASPALANTTPPGGGGGCTISASGSPGTVSFTAHITDTCGYAARAYCKYYSIQTNYGSTLYSSGSSVAECSGITEYGWQENNGTGWITHKLG